MTSQEQQMIQSLADRINNTPLSEKDPDAEQFLQQALGRNPDALYILAQTTLVQQYALEQAQKQLAEMKTQMAQQAQQHEQQPKHATSFLGNLLGLGEDHPKPAAAPQQQGQGSTPAYAPVPEYGQGYGAPPPPPPQYAQQPYGQPQYGQAPQSGGFLRSAMQTATGVAAGALAFQGIESLMHGFGGGGGSAFGSGMGGGRTEEIVNNYYGDSGSGSGEHREHQSLNSDIEDRRTDGSAFENAVNNDDHGDQGKDSLFGSDDTGSDPGTDAVGDSSFDDGSNVDDGSGSGDDSNY